jgi:DNA-binding NarL/FixJ family response regulator
MNTRVAIFDDNAQRRKGLSMLLEMTPNMDCVGLYNDCSNVLDDIEKCKPDVILMDIDMPYVNGIEGVTLIRTKHPDIKILMQTVFEDDKKVFAAICAGADGYILKQTNPMKLMEAISEVIEGGAPMTPVIARKVLQIFTGSQKTVQKKEFNLSERELEILELLVKGYGYNMIADECCISYSTVNSHVTKIYSKLQVQSATGAVSVAFREGLVR